MSAQVSLLSSTLNDQQVYAVDRLQKLLLEERKFAMLCFQCGEGKTLIAQETVRRLVQAHYIRSGSPALVVCPNSAERAWVDDAKKHFDPPLRVLTVNQATQYSIVYDDIATFDLVLITSSILRSAFKASCDERKRSIESQLRYLNTRYNPIADEERMLREDLELYRRGRLRAKLLSCELDSMQKKPDLHRKLLFTSEEEGSAEETAAASAATHYGNTQFRLILECIYKHEWPMLIVDEAHDARNDNSKLFLHLSQLRADRKLLLTATPCNNYITDVVSLFKLGGVEPPNGWHSLKHNMEEAAAYLQETRDHYIVAHNEEDSASHYKPVEIFVRLTMSDEEREAYLSVSDQWKEDGGVRDNNILSAITKLRKLCDTPTKNRAVCSYVEQVVVPRGERLIVFCNFRKTASRLQELLEERFSKHQLHVALITGDTRRQNSRNAIIQRFSRTRQAAVLLVTKVINVGTDIPAANHTITMNEWWNPATKYQAQRRVQRLSQRRSLFHLSFSTINSIEESMYLVSQVKREMSHAVLYQDITEGMMNTVTSRRALEAVDDSSPKPRKDFSATYKNILHSNLAQYIKELSSNVYRKQAGDDDGLMRPTSSRDIEHVFRNRCTLLLQGGSDFSKVPPTQQIRLIEGGDDPKSKLLASLAEQERRLESNVADHEEKAKKKVISGLFRRRKLLTSSGRLELDSPVASSSLRNLTAEERLFALRYQKKEKEEQKEEEADMIEFVAATAASSSKTHSKWIPEPVSLRNSSSRQRNQGRSRKMKFIDVTSHAMPLCAVRRNSTSAPKRRADTQLGPPPPQSSRSRGVVDSDHHNSTSMSHNYKGIRNSNQEWISSLASAFKFTTPM